MSSAFTNVYKLGYIIIKYAFHILNFIEAMTVKKSLHFSVLMSKVNFVRDNKMQAFPWYIL